MTTVDNDSAVFAQFFSVSFLSRLLSTGFTFLVAAFFCVIILFSYLWRIEWLCLHTHIYIQHRTCEMVSHGTKALNTICLMFISNETNEQSCHEYCMKYSQTCTDKHTDNSFHFSCKMWQKKRKLHFSPNPFGYLFKFQRKVQDSFFFVLRFFASKFVGSDDFIDFTFIADKKAFDETLRCVFFVSWSSLFFVFSKRIKRNWIKNWIESQKMLKSRAQSI